MVHCICVREVNSLVSWEEKPRSQGLRLCFESFQSFTWHQALTLTGNLAVLGLERGNDDGAGISIVIIVQDGVLCVIVVVIGGSRLHCVGAVVDGTVGVR